MITEELARRMAESVRGGDVETARTLTRNNPGLIQHRYGPDTWLHMAARNKNVEMVRLLIEAGCDVNARTKFGSYVLWDAIGCDSPPILQILLEHGADPSVAIDSNRLVISAIADPNEHSLELVKLLERYGADFHRVYINDMTKEPMNALSTALDWEKHDVVDYLRSKGAILPRVTLKNNASKTLDDEIVAYFSENYGPVKPQSLIEIIPSALPPIAVHVIPASKERRYITLFTTGMSSELMKVPPGEESYQFAELFIQLPADWKYMKIEDPSFGWPLHWLRSTARHPHICQTWLGGPATIIANDDPPKPLAPNTLLTSLLFLAERSFNSNDGRTVQLYRMVPLYTEERNLEMSQGIAALMLAFDRHSTPFIVDLHRPNVATVA